MGIDPDRVDRLFETGVRAIEAQTAEFTDADWDAPACGDWTASDVARHVLAVSRWYHHWLDRAEDGQSDPPFPADALDERNRAELTELATLTGPSAVSAFVTSAGAYRVRVANHWDLPYGYPFGTVTAGLHAGVAATEWHLHAWDLAAATGERYQPADPEGLFLAAAQCVTHAEGGIKGAVMGRLAPLVARRDPWATLLARAGR